MAAVNDEKIKKEKENEEKGEQVQGEEEEATHAQVEKDTEEKIEQETVSEEDDEKAKLKQEIEELKARNLRIQADLENFRKRTKTEREAAAKYRSQSLAEQLLPALDNFERALAVEVKSEESQSILTGVDMVYRQFVEALEQEGIEEIEALGEPFDPHKHQAVMQEKSEEYDSGIVSEVLQKGYQLKERVIRPSMVKVSE